MGVGLSVTQNQWVSVCSWVSVGPYGLESGNVERRNIDLCAALTHNNETPCEPAGLEVSVTSARCSAGRPADRTLSSSYRCRSIHHRKSRSFCIFNFDRLQFEGVFYHSTSFCFVEVRLVKNSILLLYYQWQTFEEANGEIGVWPFWDGHARGSEP